MSVRIKRASIKRASTVLSTAWLAYHACVGGYRLVVQSVNSMGRKPPKYVDIELWHIQRWYSNYLHYAWNDFCVLYASVPIAWISEENQA